MFCAVAKTRRRLLTSVQIVIDAREVIDARITLFYSIVSYLQNDTNVMYVN